MYDDHSVSVTNCPRRLAAKEQHSELVCHCEECKARRGNPFPFSRSDNIPCPKRGADCHASVRYFSQRHSFHLPKNNIRKFYYNMEKRKKQRFTAGEGRAYYQQGNGCGSAADGAEGAVQHDGHLNSEQGKGQARQNSQNQRVLRHVDTGLFDCFHAMRCGKQVSFFVHLRGKAENQHGIHIKNGTAALDRAEAWAKAPTCPLSFIKHHTAAQIPRNITA